MFSKSLFFTQFVLLPHTHSRPVANSTTKSAYRLFQAFLVSIIRFFFPGKQSKEPLIIFYWLLYSQLRMVCYYSIIATESNGLLMRVYFTFNLIINWHQFDRIKNKINIINGPRDLTKYDIIFLSFLRISY